MNRFQSTLPTPEAMRKAAELAAGPQGLTLEDLLARLSERFDALDEKLDTLEARISDITLDYGTGYTIED